MTVCILLDDTARIGPDLRWPLRIAAQAGGDIHLVAPGPENAAETELDLSGTRPSEGTPQLGATLRAALDSELGEGAWGPAVMGDEAPRREDEVTRVSAQVVPMKDVSSQALRPLKSSGSDLLVVVFSELAAQDGDRDGIRRELVTGTTCRIAFVRPGRRREDGDILAAASRGTHSRAALRLAGELATRQQRALTGVYVEPDIGPDAGRVGARILDRLLVDALEENAGAVARRIEVDERPASGLIRVAEDERFELVVTGMSRLGALGERSSSVFLRVIRATPEPTAVAIRSAVPIGSRIRRGVEGALQRFVPQLTRGDRVELVERIQSNSQWNFDYVLLMGLSALIASLGLLDDSAAVIIGAMLIAPLMTPLLGLGVALSQGNPRLARMAMKAVVLGFLTSFGLALITGLLTTDFVRATAEMDARNWPQELDLVVAFVGGLAAAYASGRPGLLAALPGVAIAAALVPPITTAGLAVSIKDYDLALGSLLLFGVNMVSIVMAAAVTLWAMGLRRVRVPTLVSRIAGTSLTTLAVAMTLALTIMPPRVAPPKELIEAVETTLDESLRVREIHLKKESGSWVVQIDLGGSAAPSSTLAEALLRDTRRHLGADAAVRLTYRYELLVR